MGKVKTNGTKNSKLIKFLITIICYFVYAQAFTSLFGDSFSIKMLADVIFMIGIIIAYKDNLLKDIKNIKKDYSLKKILKTIVIWVLIIIIFNILMGAITDILFPKLGKVLDANTKAIDDIFNQSFIYGIFKTVIFAVFAEEIMYREAVHDVCKNKWLFIIFSSTIYTLFNFAWTGFSGEGVIIDMLAYFIPALIFSYAYYKNNCNIIVLMLIKLVYQLLIPLPLRLISK